MNIETADVHQTLEFRTDTVIARLLPYGLVLCFLGLLGLALAEGDPSVDILVAVGVVLAAGLGLTAFALWRRFRSGRPVFVLSPMGIHYRLPTLALVPWREIEDIDVIDVTAGWGARTWTCHDVTVVLVSRQFYDSHLHKSFFRRPQGWDSVFIPKGASVQCALHHEVVSVEARALHEAVATRWQAFRDQPGEPARTSVPAVAAAGQGARREAAARAAPTPTIVAGVKPGTTSPWEAVANAAAVTGIFLALTNLLGLWATPGQIAAREERMKWQEAERQRDEEMRKMNEALRKSAKERDEMFRRFGR